MNQATKVVIAGAGFAGLNAAYKLQKLSAGQIEILAIDRGERHVYTPDLYEVANTFHPEIKDECVVELADCVSEKFEKLLNQTGIRFLRAEIESFEPKENSLIANGQKIAYDHLILALGSQQNFYGIPGLQQFAYPVKTLQDALAINCHLDSFFRYLWKKELKQQVAIVIGGGGATGVEFAAEMCGYLDKLAEKYDYPRQNIEVKIIQGGDKLIGNNAKIAQYTLERMQEIGVQVELNTRIIAAKAGKIKILKSTQGASSEREIPSDVLIWTGGVKANTIVARDLGEADLHGALAVNAFLQAQKHRNIWGAGDNILFRDAKNGKTAAWMAEVAREQGELVASNLWNEINHRPLRKYFVTEKALILPMCGPWGDSAVEKFCLAGIWRLAAETLDGLTLFGTRLWVGRGAEKMGPRPGQGLCAQ